MDDHVDAPERRARSANKLGCRAGICQVASAPRDVGAGPLTVHDDRFQSLEPCCVGSLPMQHQALIPGCQPARDRSSDPGPATGDELNAHESSCTRMLLIEQTIGAASTNANNRNCSGCEASPGTACSTSVGGGTIVG